MKKIVLSSSLLIIILVILLSIGTTDLSSEKRTFSINKSEKMVLDFGNAKIRVTGWDKDYVEIRPDEYLVATEMPFTVKSEGNRFTLEGFQDITYNKFLFKNSTWMFMPRTKKSQEFSYNAEAGIYDFEIMIPKDTSAELSAEVVKAYDCMLQMVNSPEAEIRDCRLAENYAATGRNAEIRNTEIGNNAYFRNHSLNIRECNVKNITIGTEKETGVLDAEIRELSGGNVTLEAPESNDLSLLVRDSEFDNFTVNAPRDNTSIQLRSNEIGTITNNSGSEIMTGDWKGWRY